MYRCKRDYKGIRCSIDQSEYEFHLTRDIKCNKKDVFEMGRRQGEEFLLLNKEGKRTADSKG